MLRSQQSIGRRLSKLSEWLSDRKNCHFQKLIMKGLGILMVSLFGFTAKGMLDYYHADIPDPMVIVQKLDAAIPWMSSSLFADEPLVGAALFLLILLSLIVFTLLFFVVWAAYKATRIAKLPTDKYCHPTADASLLLASVNEAADEYKTIGGVIEIARHPYLMADPSISGWDCILHEDNKWVSDIRIEHDGGLEFKFEERFIANIREPSGSNNRKYSLKRTPIDYLDASAKLSLEVHATDYYTIKRFGEAIRDNSNLRHSLSSIFPEHHRIPNSLCLHFLVQLADGNILCMLRKENSDYARGKISITGEEQFSQDDMDAGPDFAMSRWFRRAICEEVFPLRATDSGMLERHWSEVSKFVIAARVFSIFFEEEFANYSLMGFVRLDLDKSEFLEKFRSISHQHASGRDKEGKFFLLSKQEAIRYFEQNTATLSPLWQDDSGSHGQIILDSASAFSLHPSSRYRLLTFLMCTGALLGEKKQHKQSNTPSDELHKLHLEIERVTRQRDDLLLKS